jgi:hypothetical protein
MKILSRFQTYHHLSIMYMDDVQVYISEIAGPDIRGCLSAVLKIFGHIGVLISFAIGAYLDWRQLAFVIAGAPLMLLVNPPSIA